MQKQTSVEDFLKRAITLPIIDVRSPGEYEHAHIPGALNLPLFSDEERAEVGTIYKQRSRVQAVQKGLEFVGPKLKEFTKFALKLDSKEVLVHCWRGGMRSSAMAWLLGTVDLDCTLLTGGYKAYRNHVLDSFEVPLKIILLGGFTGSGKTEMLYALRDAGEQIIDLEGIANHKGSAFGSLGQVPQPTPEQFENNLSAKLNEFDKDRIIWVEDESRNVGKIPLPHGLWSQMRVAPLIRVDTSYETRLARLMRDYACYKPEELIPVIKKIEKRLGFDRCKFATEACINGDMDKVARICLDYYDSCYGDQLKDRFGSDPSRTPSITVETLDVSTMVEQLIKIKDERS